MALRITIFRDRELGPLWRGRQEGLLRLSLLGSHVGSWRGKKGFMVSFLKNSRNGLKRKSSALAWDSTTNNAIQGSGVGAWSCPTFCSRGHVSVSVANCPYSLAAAASACGIGQKGMRSRTLLPSFGFPELPSATCDQTDELPLGGRHGLVYPVVMTSHCRASHDCFSFSLSFLIYGRYRRRCHHHLRRSSRTLQSP
jgi:hypothetical protein